MAAAAAAAVKVFLKVSDDGRMIYFSRVGRGGDVRVRSSSDEDQQQQQQKMEEISNSSRMRRRLSYSRIISLSSPGRR